MKAGEAPENGSGKIGTFAGPKGRGLEEARFVFGEPGVVEVDGVGARLRDWMAGWAWEVAQRLLENKAIGGKEVGLARIALVGGWRHRLLFGLAGIRGVRGAPALKGFSQHAAHLVCVARVDG